ncbi:GroES-like protein [Auriscalpium vulgare]|uniref:GroES-like protein n=1 Tax=Auriscalpium vulgare TaxID=40419 RepID=A0ACB8S916_9AGAM|nr:GroES-like protein [Auriscalpium vulgare]
MSSAVHKALILPAKFAQFVVGELPTSKPDPGFVLVKIHAAALNPLDAGIQKMGVFITEFPGVAGNDGAGTIEAVGVGVTGLKKGDRVLYQGWWTPANRGTFQQFGIADAAVVAKIPDSMSFDEAATIPLGLATAAMGLYGKLNPKAFWGGGPGIIAPWADGGRGQFAGQPAVVIGGASSVGQFAIQLLKLSGNDPIITTASSHNEAYCKAAGATHVIDYHKTPYSDIVTAVRKITSEPVSLAYDAISSEDSQKSLWELLAPHGVLVVTHPPVVGKAGEEAEDGKRVVHVFGSAHSDDNREVGSAMYRALRGLLEEGVIKGNKVEVLPNGLAGIPDGLARLWTKTVSGLKLVSRPQETA